MMHKYVLPFVAALLPATFLQAQNDTKSRPALTTPGVSSPGDPILATWLHVGSTNEASLANVALERAQNADVRAFAQKMIVDHNAFATKLQPLTNASGNDVDKNGNGGRPGEHGKEEQGASEKSRTNPKSPADANATRRNTAVGNFDHAALIRDLGKKCQQSETEMLSSKTDADFDRAYMAMVVASHVRAADTLEVFKAYASPSLLPILEAGHKTVAAHLQQAKALCKRLEEGAAGNGANGKRPGDGR